MPDYNLDNSLYKNYVFPAKRQKTKGHCSFLYSIFEMTDPITWNFAKSLGAPINIEPPNSSSDFNILDHKLSYKNTQFGQIEKIIGSMKFRKLHTT